MDTLFKKIIDSTGLPKDLLTKELTEILSKKGMDPSEVNIEDLREAMSDYLKKIISEAKVQYKQGAIIEEEIEPDDLGL